MTTIEGILSEIRPEVTFTAEMDLIADGALDSFDMITLVSELDRKFDISIEGIDIIPDNFRSIRTIEALLKRYGVEF